jgi:hypothetical protein
MLKNFNIKFIQITDKEAILLFSTLLSLIFTALILLIFSKYIFFQEEYSKQFIEGLFIKDFKYFKNEKIETINYFLFVIVSSFLLFLLINYFIKKKFFIFKYKIYLILLYTFIVFAIYFFSVLSYPDLGFKYIEKFINNYIFYTHTIFSISILSFAIVFFFYLKKKIDKILFLKFFNLVYPISIYYIFILLFLLNVFSLNAFKDNGIFSFHFDPVYFSVVQVMGGDALLLNNFTNQYGLYPQFLEPFFRVFGLNLFNFSIIMSLLLCALFLFIYLFIDSLVTNKFVVLTGFSAVIFFSYFSIQISSEDYYFQLFPIRFFFLGFILLIISKNWITVKNEKLYSWYGYIISSISILWNFEFGIVLFLSFLFYVLYRNLYEKSFDKAVKKILINILKSFFVLILILIFYSFYIYFRYDNFPNYLDLISAHKLFTLGYYMLPIPIIYPWNLLCIIYLLSLSVCIYNLRKKKIKEWSSKFFFITIYGIGIFFYYLGRSVDGNLIAISFPAIIVLVLYLEILLKNIRKNNQISLNFIISVFIIFFFTSSYLSLFSNFEKFYKLSKTRNSWFGNNIDKNLKNNIECIKKNTQTGEKILLLSKHQAILHNQSKTFSVYTPALTELIYVSDSNRLLELINKRNNLKIFLENDFNIKTIDLKILLEIEKTVTKKFILHESCDNSSLNFYLKKK